MQCILPEDQEHVITSLTQSVDGNQKLDIEYRIKRPDGEIRYIRDRAFAIRDVDGNITNVAGIAEDITSWREIEAEIKQHKSQIARLARINTAGELVSSIAHELNQPLTTVSQYIGGSLLQIKQDKPKDEIIATLEKARHHIQRAGDIVHNLKSFLYKGQQQKQIVNSINDLVETALTLVHSEMIEANIKLVKELPQATTKLRIDTIQIEQVILNLMQNAIEAMMHSNNKRILSIYAYTKENSFFIDIEDTGVGFAEAQDTKIFQPFYTTKDHGIGLGLSISNSIIEAHGGRLDVVSRLEVGTRFSIQLPYHQEK